jgi:hypothetical protein
VPFVFDFFPYLPFKKKTQTDRSLELNSKILLNFHVEFKIN